MLNLIYVLLFLAVVIALFGIANTLALSVVERRRELGLLRAVGMQRRQVRSSVRWEAVLIALLGTAVGTALGLGFGWAMVKAMAQPGHRPGWPFPGCGSWSSWWSVRWPRSLAAALPARRAARLDALRGHLVVTHHPADAHPRCCAGAPGRGPGAARCRVLPTSVAGF